MFNYSPSLAGSRARRFQAFKKPDALLNICMGLLPRMFWYSESGCEPSVSDQVKVGKTILERTRSDPIESDNGRKKRDGAMEEPVLEQVLRH